MNLPATIPFEHTLRLLRQESANYFSHLYSCPYCAMDSLSYSDFFTHVFTCEFYDPKKITACPICVTRDGGSPEYKITNLRMHLEGRHRATDEYTRLEGQYFCPSKKKFEHIRSLIK